MDTSKTYYDSVMRDFHDAGLSDLWSGRTLEQYCRYETCEDENAVRKYHWRI